MPTAARRERLHPVRRRYYALLRLGLTPEEATHLVGWTSGLHSETCRDLGITHNTLSVHLADISERLGLTSVRSLVIFKAVGWAKR